MRHIPLIAVGSFAAVLALGSVAQAQAPQAAPTTTQSPAQVRAGTYVIDPAHSKITWSVTHFGFSTYVGQFTGVAATLKLDPKALTATDLQVTVDAGSVGTLNPALDNHLKSAEFLDVAKYPQATFKATSVKQTGANTADITGDFTLHGVTRPVVIHATFNQAGVNMIDHKYSLGFAGQAVLQRSAFGVKTYSPAVGEDVTLQIEAEFKAAN